MYCLVLFNIAAYKVRQEGRMEPWADGDEGERQSSGCAGVVPRLRWERRAGMRGKRREDGWGRDLPRSAEMKNVEASFLLPWSFLHKIHLGFNKGEFKLKLQPFSPELSLWINQNPSKGVSSKALHKPRRVLLGNQAFPFALFCVFKNAI